jgi:Zn-dependent peptidase ImmA (M78 family)/DNA-binding XRE family transcriptional regulator
MSTENVIGTNVMRLRAAKGMSQSALAERAHLSRPGLAKIERGHALPRPNTLRDLARALGVTTVELATPVQPLHTVRFRARKKVREREQLLAEVSNWLDDYCFVEDLVGSSQAFLLADLRDESRDPRHLAEAARKRLDLDDQPIHDICGLLEKCGVKVLRIPRATDAFFGLSVKEDDGGPAVVINTWERISVERWIFSAAHELGHLLLHPGSYDHKEEQEPKEEEKQADLFASFFLMPHDSFAREWADASGHPLYERILKVKRIFHVSYKTVLLRLIQCGEATKDIFQVFQVQHKRRYGKTLKKADEPQPLTEHDFDEGRAMEPDRLSDADCLDDRLRRLVRQAVEGEEISLSRAAEILRLSLMDMRQLAAEWAT